MSADIISKLKLTLLMILLIHLGFYTYKNAPECTIGFISGYTASSKLLNEQSVVDFYNSDEFIRMVQETCQNTIDIYTPNPPGYSLLMLPLVWFNFSTAKTMWVIISLILVFLSIRLLRRGPLKHVTKVDLVILILLFQPLYVNLRMGQTYTFLLFLITLLWYGWKYKSHTVAGIALSLMTFLKIGVIWLWPLLLVSKEWRILRAACICTGIMVVGSLPVIGMEAWLKFFSEIAVVSERPAGGVTAYQSIPGFLRHFFTYDVNWNPNPLFNTNFMGFTLHKIISPIMIIFLMFYGFVSDNIDLKVAFSVIVSILISPLTLDYHFLIVVLPIVLLYQSIRDFESVWILRIYIASVLLIALPLPYTNPVFSEGIMSFLAYPKLYGGLMLLVIVLVFSLKEIKASSQVGRMLDIT